jgi:hypothetical protein
VFLLSYLPPCYFQLSRTYSYTLTYPTVLTIVHCDGTYILSHDNSHSPAMIPYSISGVPLKPSIHLAGFLGMLPAVLSVQ